MRGSTHHGGAIRLPYMPALDGLRAFAVLAVILYHAGLALVPGGFLGVEVFFVISGYLITALLRARQGTGDGGIVEFWQRRARRLFPAMWLLIALVLCFTAVALPGELAALRHDAAAGLSYSTNWWLIFEQQSYFEAAGRPSLLQHLWSLAVEEQFYLLWPILFAFVFGRLRPRFAAALLGSLALAGSLWMGLLFDPDVDPSRIYYGTDTRVSGLLVGAALSFVLPAGARLPRAAARPLQIGGCVAFLGLSVLCVTLNEYDVALYRGGMLGIALLSAVVIAAVVHEDAGPAARWLGTPLLSAIGRRSYSLYLWHWPVFMVTRPQLDVPFSGGGWLLCQLAICGALSECSYRCVEYPIRRGAATGALARAQQRMRELGLRLGPRGAIGVAGAALLGVLWMAVFESERSGFAPSDLAQASNQTAARGASDRGASGSPAGEARVPACEPTAEPASTDTPRPTSIDASAAGRRDSLRPRDWAARQRTPSSVLALGDSVMRGAARQLRDRELQVTVDAKVGRQVSDSLAHLLALRRGGQLAPVVVVHLGNNGTFREHQFERMMRLLEPVSSVVFVNTRVPRRWQEPNNQVIVEGVSRHAKAVLLDWKAYSAQRPDWFTKDGYHLGKEGARAYADVLRSYYFYASDGEWKERRKRSRARGGPSPRADGLARVGLPDPLPATL